MTDEAMAEKINQAITTGEEFSKRYYKILDQERQTIDKMYHEEAVLSWNGNAVEGMGPIKTFLQVRGQEQEQVLLRGRSRSECRG